MNWIFLFLQNWVMDYLILSMVKSDFFPHVRKGRTAAGAFLAAATYLLWLVQRDRVPGTVRQAEAVIFICLVFLFVCSVRPVRKKWPVFLKIAGASAAYTFLMGGFAFALDRVIRQRAAGFFRQWGVTAGCVLFFLLWQCAGRRIRESARQKQENLYEVEVQRNGRTAVFTGLYDSGNLLKSQWTGRGICVLSLKEAQALLDDREKEALSYLAGQSEFPWKSMTSHLWRGIYRITYSAVGREDGWMPAVMADRILVKRDGNVLADRGGLLGITTQDILRDGDARMLLPADIFSRAAQSGPAKD